MYSYKMQSKLLAACLIFGIGCGPLLDFPELNLNARAQTVHDTGARFGLKTRLIQRARAVRRSAVIGERLIERLIANNDHSALTQIFFERNSTAALLGKYTPTLWPFLRVANRAGTALDEPGNANKAPSSSFPHGSIPKPRSDLPAPKGSGGTSNVERLNRILRESSFETYTCLSKVSAKFLRRKSKALFALAKRAHRLSEHQLDKALTEAFNDKVELADCGVSVDWVGGTTTLSVSADSKCLATDVVKKNQFAPPYFPQVAAILSDASPVAGSPICTGTLIGPNAVLTAAHCICGAARAGPGGRGFDSYVRCVRNYFQRDGSFISPLDVRDLSVHFQHGGQFRAQQVYIHPKYSWAGGLSRGDLAIVILQKPVSTIKPTAISRRPTRPIARRNIGVGFGWSNPIGSNGRPTNVYELETNTGIKLTANVVRQPCYLAERIRGLLCWDYRTADNGLDLGSACHGDSGGPLFVNSGNERLLAGVITAGTGCRPGARAYAADLSRHRGWISRVLARKPSIPASDGQSLKQLFCRYYDIVGKSTAEVLPAIPKGSSRLRVSVNCTPSPGRATLAFKQLEALPTDEQICGQPGRQAATMSCDIPVAKEQIWQFKLVFDLARGQACQIVASSW